MSHNKQRRGGFRTDTDISRGKAAKAGERELQAWQPDSDTAGAGGGLEDETFGAGSGKRGGAGWDQFATNVKLFGATTTYSEDLYTTRLDRSTPGFREREKVAERLAGEIEGQVSANVHVAEERGQKVAEDWDEEARFSGVKRGGSAYVPPGARREEKESKEVPKLVIPPKAAAAVNVTSPAATPSKTENMTDSLRRFAQTEREKIAQAKVDIAKTERERRLAELKAFGRSFKVPARVDGKETSSEKPSEKSEKPDAKPAAKPESVKPSAPTHTSPSKPKIAMRIPEIPPFRGAAPPKVEIPVTADRAVPVVKPEVKEVKEIKEIKEVKPAAPVPALNPAAAAFAFKPNPSASSFKPGAPVAKVGNGVVPPVKPVPPIVPAAPISQAPPRHPFFLTPPRRVPGVNVREEFNPIRSRRATKPEETPMVWQYSGRRVLHALHQNQPMQPSGMYNLHMNGVHPNLGPGGMMPPPMGQVPPQILPGGPPHANAALSPARTGTTLEDERFSPVPSQPNPAAAAGAGVPPGVLAFQPGGPGPAMGPGGFAPYRGPQMHMGQPGMFAQYLGNGVFMGNPMMQGMPYNPQMMGNGPMRPPPYYSQPGMTSHPTSPMPHAMTPAMAPHPAP